MLTQQAIKFINNPAVKNTKGKYLSVEVSTSRILKSWQLSLFSFEWLNPDGSIKTLADLPQAEQDKRKRIERMLADNQPIMKPILGIGIQNNIEIGSGRAEFLTLASHGLEVISVHIPESHNSDFKRFLFDVD